MPSHGHLTPACCGARASSRQGWAFSHVQIPSQPSWGAGKAHWHSQGHLTPTCCGARASSRQGWAFLRVQIPSQPSWGAGRAHAWPSQTQGHLTPACCGARASSRQGRAFLQVLLSPYPSNPLLSLLPCCPLPLAWLRRKSCCCHAFPLHTSPWLH